MRVNVTEKHINNGHVKDSQHCMIADAIKEACPSALWIMVDLQTIRYSDPAKRKRYKFLTPAVAQRNLLKFDKGEKTIRPFSFTLSEPIVRAMDPRTERRAKAKAKKADKRTTRANKKKYAYLAANRALKVREREFGLRKFVDEAAA